MNRFRCNLLPVHYCYRTVHFYTQNTLSSTFITVCVLDESQNVWFYQNSLIKETGLSDWASHTVSSEPLLRPLFLLWKIRSFLHEYDVTRVQALRLEGRFHTSVEWAKELIHFSPLGMTETTSLGYAMLEQPTSVPHTLLHSSGTTHPTSSNKTHLPSVRRAAAFNRI